MRLLGLNFRFLLPGAVFFAAATLAAEVPLPASEPIYSDSPVTLPAFTLSALDSYRASTIFSPGETVNYPRNLSLRWLQTTPPPPKPPKPPAEKVERAAINPSMVGYIDDAIVHSQIRVRFDAALDDKTPDRAEFFYAKCGCYRGAGGTLHDANSPGPGDGVPKNINFQQLYFLGEYAHGSRLSAFVELPLRWIQAVPDPSQSPLNFPDAGGIGDIHLGIKVAPLVFTGGYVTLQFKASVPSGDALKGLGTNHASIEPSLLYFQRLSGRLSVEAEIGDNHPISSSAGVPNGAVPPNHGFAGDVLFYGVGPSYQFVNNERIQAAGVLELVGWNVRSGYVTGPANPSTAGVNIVNLKVGPRISFRGHHSVYFGYGIALTSQTWYHEIFRTEYRYAF